MWSLRNPHGLIPGGYTTPARDGRHFISSAASEAAQSSRALHSDKQPRATFPPTIVCPSGRRQQNGGERRWFGKQSIREPVARCRVVGRASRNVMQSNEEGVCKTTAQRHRESMGVGELQMLSCHHCGTALTMGLGVKRLRQSGVQK
jgi:hypothetical protein